MPLSTLLRFMSLLEAVTGVALLCLPAAVTFLFFGDEPAGVGIAVGRVAGIAIFALAAACWPQRDVEPDAISTWAMFTYSMLIAIYLGALGAFQSSGPLLWPAVIAHVLFLFVFVAVWSRDRHRVAT